MDGNGATVFPGSSSLSNEGYGDVSWEDLLDMSQAPIFEPFPTQPDETGLIMASLSAPDLQSTGLSMPPVPAVDGFPLVFEGHEAVNLDATHVVDSTL